jgi:hypothetical protein
MMAKILSVEAVLEILRSGKFEEITGTIEDGQIEFKGTPYQLGTDIQKCELAKDVSALANANGGLILIGFRTSKDENVAVEYVDVCRPFDLALFDADQYRKILDDWISPPVSSVDIVYYPSISEVSKGVAAISVSAAASLGKPYLVNRTVEVDGKVRGTQFGYYERVQDRVPAISAETLRSYVKDGMRFAEITQRLDTIEAFLGSYIQTPATGLTESDISDRISEAEKAIERTSRPNIILAAISVSPCTFPDLFISRSAPIVQLLEEPPILRKDGFAITPKESNPSEIIQGKLRRIVVRGHKLIDLWHDGALITVGPGDDDLLCWFTRSHTNPKPGLPIRSFVLAEVALNFCMLAIEIFKNAEPKPNQLKFILRLNNMTEEGVPCSLSTNEDHGPNTFSYGHTKHAPDTMITSSYITSFKDIDVGIVVYKLLGQLYAEFGFNYENMPYIQRDEDANRVTKKSVLERPL